MRPPVRAPRDGAAPVTARRRTGKVYVVTAPEKIRGIYETWDACRAAVSGVAGARYQGTSRDVAEAMLRGEGLQLEPGSYAFIDGNAMGGIGVVLVTQPESGSASVSERALTVYDVFKRSRIPSLDTRAKITAATDSLRNVLAELGALHAAIEAVPPGSTLTVVHDYEGVGAWVEGRWKVKNPIVAEVVAACRVLIEARRLRVRFRHQRAHESTFAGRNDFATYNARADKLATEAALKPD